MSLYSFPKSEHGIQSAGFNWVRRNRAHSPNELVRMAMKLCHAIPNGLSTKQSQKAKMEGLTKGIPDIHLPWPICQEVEEHTLDRLGKLSIKIIDGTKLLKVTPGLYIEMKYKSNTLSDEQKKIQAFLLALGYCYRVCYSTEQMIQTIKDYLPFEDSDYLPPEYL